MYHTDASIDVERRWLLFPAPFICLSFAQDFVSGRSSAHSVFHLFSQSLIYGEVIPIGAGDSKIRYLIPLLLCERPFPSGHVEIQIMAAFFFFAIAEYRFRTTDLMWSLSSYGCLATDRGDGIAGPTWQTDHASSANLPISRISCLLTMD